jgi:hypothetical protein
MATFDQTFPGVLTELHQLEFDYDDGEGIDFEPYQEFQSAEDNAGWLQPWTGNPELTGAEYRVFGQDGTGGYACIWVKREGKGLLEQPIVFFGSEGDVGVVASDFSDYLWLLAGGVGPKEAVENFRLTADPNDDFTEFAKRHAKGKKRTPTEVVARAEAEFPTFEDDIRALCKT